MSIVFIDGIPTSVGNGADEIIKLRAENAQLRGKLSDREDDIRTEQLWVTHWKEECDKLQEQLAAAQIDAKRYRWLREHPGYMGWEHDFRADEIDAAIDAEMKGEQPEQEK